MFNVGGWGCESNREIVFVSFVRACERSCVCLRGDVASVAGLREDAACSETVRACVPFLVVPFVIMMIMKQHASPTLQ